MVALRRARGCGRSVVAAVSFPARSLRNPATHLVSVEAGATDRGTGRSGHVQEVPPRTRSSSSACASRTGPTGPRRLDPSAGTGGAISTTTESANSSWFARSTPRTHNRAECDGR
jgi:hypothetical protein